MSRMVLYGGRIFDGTGSPVADGDVAFQDGRIVEVGTGLDGDDGIDVGGCTLLPGLFDCHVHVTSSGTDFLRRLQRPSPTSSTRQPATLPPPSTAVSPPSGTRAGQISAFSRPSTTALSTGRGCASRSRS